MEAENAEDTVGNVMLQLMEMFQGAEKYELVFLMKSLDLPEAQANAFYERFKKGASHEDRVPKLSDLCIKLIASKNEAVDRLFEIYGPATNFPIRKFKPESKN